MFKNGDRVRQVKNLTSDVSIFMNRPGTVVGETANWFGAPITKVKIDNFETARGYQYFYPEELELIEQ